jgi:hypothetical protein
MNELGNKIKGMTNPRQIPYKLKASDEDNPDSIKQNGIKIL